MDLGVGSVVAIVVICYLFGAGMKAWDLFDDRKIPVLMGVLGAAFGILAFILTPTIMPADNVIDALAIGIVSGLSATGVNQIYKQSKKEE